MELMTLAISETSKNKYNVVVVDIDALGFYLIKDLKKDQIISNANEPFWDIGAVTRADSFHVQEEVLRITGPCEIVAVFDKEKFKTMLRRLSSKKSDFFENKKRSFDIVKVRQVSRIWSDKNQKSETKHRLEAHVFAEKKKVRLVDGHGVDDAGGDYAVIELLNKDFRWVQYWDWVESEQNDIEARRQKYMKMLNSSRLEKFFVMYRCFFKDGSELRWISGIHAL